MLPSPFDTSISFISTRAGDLSQGFPASEYEARFCQKMSKNRKGLFLAGRAAAHAALEKLAIPSVPIIGIGEHKEPLWPDTFCGSIAHTGTVAIAAAASASSVASVGVDIEKSARPIQHDILKRICTPVELEQLAAANTNPSLPLMIFSAKETAFKVLHPICKSKILFEDVQLSFCEDFSSIDAQLMRTLHPQLPEETTFEIRVTTPESYIMTSAILRNL